MKVREPLRLPADKRAAMHRIVRLEWYNIGWRLSIVAVLYLVLGNSQAMKVAWLEDSIALLPPIAFLIAMRYRDRPPSEEYPYGCQAAMNIAFLASAVALLAMGLILLIDSGLKLISREHPSIGGIELFGRTIWLGWLMIAGLVYSVIPPMILGYLQQKAAVEVHEKTVFADASMSRADWMTGLAAIVGIVGVGFGLWWADAAAAGLIALSITKDGLTNLREAGGNLLSRRPHTTAAHEVEPVTAELEQLLRGLPWVADAAVRLREEGHVFSGEAFVVPRIDSPDDEVGLTHRMVEASRLLQEHDWRLYEVLVTPTERLPQPSR